ncbi:MAG: amidohydrolase family protein [Actinomycetota bacterium]
MSRIVFRGGAIFDGTGAPIADGDVVIEDGLIADVGRGLDGDEAVECAGKAVLPGLFDCHIHLALRYEDLDELHVLHRPMSYGFFAVPETLRTTLALGITSVRDASFADAGLRQAVRDGLLVGPRMQLSVNMLSMTGGHNDDWLPSGGRSWALEYPGMPTGVCDGVAGVTRKVREMIRAGADVIKIASSGGFLSPSDDPRQPNFSQEEVDAIVRAAGDLGRWVMSHAHGAEGIKRAVRAGVRSIEHGTFLDAEAAEMMRDAGTWLVPTLTAADTDGEILENPGVAEAVKAKYRELGDHPERAAFRLAAETGVRVAMGTDCPVAPHGTKLRELELMAGNGFTPEQALHAATGSAAELLGWDDRLGTLEPGKVADLVVVDGDPFGFATLKDRVEQVWMEGVRVVPFS